MKEAGPTPSPSRVADLRRAAHAYVQRATGCDIDLSEESLAFVDHYLGTVRGGGAVSDEILPLIAAAVGVHLGEVAIAKYGGAWRGPAPADGEAGGDDPALWRVELESAPLSFDPIGMAAEALRQGEVEGYEAGMHTRPELSSVLEDALSRAAPVSDEYYYSLTGRFETLGYAVDILTEILHLKKEAQAGGETKSEEELN